MNNNLLVLQSDFGLVDGAVSAMIGVALEESLTLKIHHLTHHWCCIRTAAACVF